MSLASGLIHSLSFHLSNENGCTAYYFSIGLCGKIGWRVISQHCSPASETQPWPSFPGPFVLQQLGCEQRAFLTPVWAPKQRQPSRSLAVPNRSETLYPQIFTQHLTPPSRESLKLFWKETILPQGPIFRLYKAHVRSLLSFSLSTRPAVWKAMGSFVFKSSAPAGSNS